MFSFYTRLLYARITVDIYEEGTVVISYQDVEGINHKYISVDKADLTKLKRQIDKFDNAIIEIDKENVEKISVYPFNNSINVVTDRDKINSLIEQFYGSVCDKCEDIDISTKKYEIEVVTKDGKTYNIVLNSDGSVGYYFNNEYYLSKKKTISVLYFDSVLNNNGTYSYVRSRNRDTGGVGFSANLWVEFPGCYELHPIWLDYIASSENDGEITLEIYYGYAVQLPPVTSPMYPKNWGISIIIMSESEDGNEIKENIFKGGIAYLPKSQASCDFINGRAVYGRTFTTNIDLCKYILIDDNFKNGKIKIEVSCDCNELLSREIYLNYKKIDDGVELSISK